MRELTLVKQHFVLDAVSVVSSSKLRLLLEAGADPRIEDEDGHSPFSRLQDKIEYIESSPKYPSIESKGKLESLQREIMERVHELNNKGERHT